MYAVSMMKVSFRENENEEWKRREIAYVFNDMTDIEGNAEYFKKGWMELLKAENIKGENRMKLKFKKLDDKARIPSYAHEGDSGMDVASIEEVVVPPHSFVKVRTGLAAEIPDGYEIQVRPRSGLAAKNGIVAAFGTVDSGYRGEICVTLFSSRNFEYEIFEGERIAQFVLSPIIRADIEETDTLGATERGSDGFGSTGR